MFKKVFLTALEKKVIKRIARRQLKNLNSILDNTGTLDVPTFLLTEDLNVKEFENSVKTEIAIFEEVLKTPSELFNLEQANLAIAKHIMMNMGESNKLAEGKRGVWKKFMVLDQFPEICPQ
jgi:hypothetical protein